MHQKNNVTTQDKRDLRWLKMYPLYIEFKEIFHREPKMHEIYKGEKLGVWVSNQRRADRKDACSRIRKEQLNDTAIESKGLQNKLKKMVKLYLAFKEEYHREPRYDEVYQGENLGIWLKNQKSSAKRGNMSKKRQEQLISAGIVLFEDVKEERWNETCSLYIEYVQKYGRGPDSNEKYKNVGLGWWVKQQRRRSATEKELLQQQYKNFLLKNGYTKDPLDLYWKKMYGFCLKFIEKYNRVPKYNEQYWGKPIGCWYFYQNKLHQYNWLSDEQLSLLKKIMPEEVDETIINWGKHQEKWEKACLLYVEYVQKNGCGPGPNEMYKKENLGKWVSAQRKRLKTEKEILKEQYKTVLLRNGYLEDPLEMYWQEMYTLYREFFKINNRTPKNEEVYLSKPLGNWLAYQVKLMKYNWLSEDKYRLLALYT